MDIAQPPVIPTPERRRRSVALNILFIAALVLLLQLPLLLVNNLRQERAKQRGVPEIERIATTEGVSAAEGYRMVERALKYSPLVLALVFTAFFLFETLTALRLHVVHYALVGAALGLFYLALLALGEVLPPGGAYAGAAVASSLLIVLYCRSILHSAVRAGWIAGLLAGEHSALYVVLRMEEYALLAGTAALFAALGAVMFFTRNVDWFAQDSGKGMRA